MRMYRLASLLFTLISSALAGSAVIAVLVAGFVSVPAIVGAAAAGAAVAVPVSWVVARKLYTA
jgi:hypothetical protein